MMLYKHIILILLLPFFLALETSAQQTLNFDPAVENMNHDIHLSPWGPYSKKYVGISHIANMKSGMRFDFSVSPGYYRNKVMVPNVLFESGYNPWKADPKMNSITYRYQLEWKDQVYTDITYHTLDSSRVLVEMDCANNTNVQQNITLNSLAYIDYPGPFPLMKATGTESMKWINAVDYSSIDLVIKSPKYHLVTDGFKLGEVRSEEALDGSLLADKFGKEVNDEVAYTIDQFAEKGDAVVFIRYRVKKGETSVFQLSGISDEKISFTGTGSFEFKRINCKLNSSNQLKLRSVAGTEIELNGFYITSEKDPKTPQLVSNTKEFIPEIQREKDAKALILKYKDISSYYGMAWDYVYDDVREVLNDELDIYFKMSSNNNVTKRFMGNQKGHYMDLFFRPVELQPHSHRKLYILLCSGTQREVKEEIKKFSVKELVAQIIKPLPEPNILPSGNQYKLGNQLLQAALLSNLVYPIYTQRNYIRHFTPGKWWNSLYTWDVGFIALGMQEVDIMKSFEAMNAYTTNVGNQSAFIHHGSPVPVQFYAFYDLWNRTQSKELLTYMYPRLKQYFNFMTGITATSTTKMPSGLLKTWDYFYNSGGWDDYPPQKYLRDNQQIRPNVTPVITTAQCIRAAKIMRMCAGELGFTDDIKQYDQQISQMSSALQNNSWDESVGYYSYVTHDAQGQAQKIFRYPTDSSNYNMGLDGVSPLISGIASKAQQKKMIDNIFSLKHLWTPYGISAVDQSATYFRQDGYWNGTVWMPHQWFMWKAMLDMGEADKAWQIAHTALELWKRETNLTYSTYEHFISSSGRGAGWSQFSGLSAPVLNWFASYYKIGTVTTGLEVWIDKQHFGEKFSSYTATLRFDQTSNHQRCILICLDPANKYEAFFNNNKLKTNTRFPGLLEVYLSDTNKQGELRISISKK